jgi:progressive ankylosis protein
LNNISTQLTNKKIFYFWLPLAATWIMMSVEGPFLAALIARSTEPEFNLAAYGVAYSLALIVEAPIIMMMSASIALVKDSLSFNKLRNFTYTANGIITVIMIILVTPPVFYFLAGELIGLPDEVSRLTHIATIVLIPWPSAIGYRRFYQGLLIKNNKTRRVAHGTIIRLLSMSICATTLYLSGIVEGVIIGAASLSFAVVMEAIAVKFMVRETVHKIKSEISDLTQRLSYKEIFRFYYPLALTSLIGLGVQPLVIFFVGQSRMSLESLAVLPVVTSFVFIFRALGLSFQEVVIALLDEKRNEFRPLLKFAIILASILVLVLALFAFTPLAEFWFITVSGLSSGLANFAKLPLMIMFFFPALTVLISFQRGLLVSDKNTKPITLGTIIEFITIVIMLLILINFLDLVGAVAATIGFVAGRLAANFYLMDSSFRSIKNLTTGRAIEL